ncbi:MAG: hypothetical protein JWR44_1583 [Hymenobacter sp.]|jgi:hypothetical protein|nr:hypothetical protein [Hymenobacter sp.]
MRYIAFLLLLFTVGFTLPACAQKATSHKTKMKKTSKKTTATKPKIETQPVLTFQRTACFGTCPSYTMQVFADGRVAYEGQRFVPIVGQKELRLPVATVNEMLRKVQEAHFDQFDSRYAQNTSDLPSVVVAVRQPGGKFKTVQVEEGEPANVRELMTYLGTRFDALAELQTTSDR